MKKILLVLLVLSSVFAAFAIFDGNIVLNNLTPEEGPLFREPYADPYSLFTKMSLQKALDMNLRPATIRTSVLVKDNSGTPVETRYVDLPYDAQLFEYPEENSYFAHLRLGTSTSFARFTYDQDSFLPKIEGELAFGGALNTLFNIFGNSNALGFDGTWFIGLNAKIEDSAVLHLGVHHFSGHYSDETIDKFYDYNKINVATKEITNVTDFLKKDSDSDYSYFFNGCVEYVRDNSYLIGLSKEFSNNIRLYGECEIPWNHVWLRPFADAPASSSTLSGNKVLLDSLGEKEGFSDLQIETEKSLKNNNFYKALRVHFGIDYSKAVSNWGLLYFGTDIQAHQDGQTKHMPGQYDPSNSWEYELTSVLGITFAPKQNRLSSSLELCYHNGRTTTTDFYYQRMKTLSIAVVLR